jgi:subfamily B ATP-binding cassette protein MsbA
MATILSNRSPEASHPSSLPANAGQRDHRALYQHEQEPCTVREAWHLLRRNWHFIARHRRLLALKCVLSFSSLTFFLLTPWPVKLIIDHVFLHRPLSGIWAAILLPVVGDSRAALLLLVLSFLALTAVLIGIVGRGEQSGIRTATGTFGLDQAGVTAQEVNEGWSLWNGLFGYLETRITIDLTQRINQDVRTALYARFLRAPLAVFDEQRIGDAVFRVMHDSVAVGLVLYRGILGPALAAAMLLTIALVLTLALRHQVPLLPVCAAAALPVVCIGAALYGRLLRRQGQTMRERGSEVMAAFAERLAQIQLIKAFGQEEREAANIDSASWESYRAALRMLGLWLLLGLTLTPVVALIPSAAFYYVMTQVIHGHLTLGEVTVLLAYAVMLVRPVRTLGAAWARLQGPIAGLRRVQSVLDWLPEGSDAATCSDLQGPIRIIEFDDVSLGYSGAPILSHLSLTLHRGELIAIAGPSGVGKTTLLYAIPRFLEPIAGTIRVNHQDARRLALGGLRSRVGCVFQQEALFAVSIAENIRYGRAEASDIDMREAARLAGAAEFIEGLPEGYATLLGRRGARLSMGQQQRIALARALLRQPEVLLLDEPTAPLDPRSEAALLRTLRELARDRIVILVTHRAATLAACTRVYFVAGGGIAASGTHCALLASNADYRRYLAVTEPALPVD